MALLCALKTTTIVSVLCRPCGVLSFFLPGVIHWQSPAQCAWHHMPAVLARADDDWRGLMMTDCRGCVCCAICWSWGPKYGRGLCRHGMAWHVAGAVLQSIGDQLIN